MFSNERKTYVFQVISPTYIDRKERTGIRFLYRSRWLSHEMHVVVIHLIIRLSKLKKITSSLASLVNLKYNAFLVIVLLWHGSVAYSGTRFYYFGIFRKPQLLLVTKKY